MEIQAIQEFFQQNFWIFYAGFIGIIILYLFLSWFNSRGKVKVRLLQPLGPRIFFKKPLGDGRTIIMEKSVGKKTGWKFTFDQTYPTTSFWLFKRPTVDVLDGAEKAISYDYEKKTMEQPCWDRKREEEAFQAGVIKAAAATGQKLTIPTLLWLLIAGNLILSFINFIVARGVPIA